MNYPHLYIKSLLEEVKECNQKMITLHNEYTKQRYLNYNPKDYNKIINDIEEKSLYIEQLNQEIVNTTKNMDNIL